MKRAIADMPNLGPVMARCLAEIGITNEKELRQAGALAAYVQLKFRFGREITLNALWSMEGALTGTSWKDIPEARKRALRQELSTYS